MGRLFLLIAPQVPVGTRTPPHTSSSHSSPPFSLLAAPPFSVLLCRAERKIRKREGRACMWSHIPLSSLPRSPRSRSLATCFSSRAPRLLVFSFERSGAAISSASPLVINFRSVQQDFKNFFVAIYAATVILVGASNATAMLP